MTSEVVFLIADCLIPDRQLRTEVMCLGKMANNKKTAFDMEVLSAVAIGKRTGRWTDSDRRFFEASKDASELELSPEGLKIFLSSLGEDTPITFGEENFQIMASPKLLQ